MFSKKKAFILGPFNTGKCPVASVYFAIFKVDNQRDLLYGTLNCG